MLPKYRQPTHPGEVLLEDFLKPMDMTQAALAQHFGWSYAKVNEIIKGRRGVTPETALSLADAFGTTAQFWLNLQQNFDLWQAQQKHAKVNKITRAS